MALPVPSTLAVGLGGAIGASLRVGLDDLAGDAPGWPVTTLVANLVGTAILAGLIATLPRFRPSGRLAALVGGGLCGALTTFATLQVEVVRLAGEDGFVPAAAYGAGSIAAGLVIAFGAVRLTGRLFGATR